jgi:hypothetical protein
LTAVDSARALRELLVFGATAFHSAWSGPEELDMIQRIT